MIFLGKSFSTHTSQSQISASLYGDHYRYQIFLTKGKNKVKYKISLKYIYNFKIIHAYTSPSTRVLPFNYTKQHFWL